MSLNDTESLELAALCDGLIDGTLSEADHQRLQRWLLESEEARRFYVQYAGLSASLCHYAGELQSDAAEPMPAYARIIRHPACRWTLGAIAAMAMIALSIAKLWPQNDDALDTDRFVAVLLQTKNCKWVPGNPAPKTGEHLNRGQVLSISGGLAEIAFDCGAIVVIEGPASLELDSAWAATLRHGTLRARVPPEAVGFRVSNPAVEVVDLGTEFAVVANEDGAAEVLVLEGSVEAASGGKPVVLREKEGRRFAKSGPTDIHDRDRKLERLSKTLTLDVPPAQLAFVRWSFDESEGDTATASVVGMPGPHPVVRFESAAAKARERGPGRWGQALRLDGTFGATAPFPSIASHARRTVAFWVRVPVDAPLTGGQTILAWGDKARARKSGYPATLLGWNARPSQGAVGALRADRGPDAVVGTTTLRDGAWHHIAATFVPAGRARRLLHVRLYVDGRLEATSASKPKRPTATAATQPGPDEMPPDDTLWIGRAPGGRSRSDRFHGDIDELFIADRALTAQEIRRLMKKNDPSAPREDPAKPAGPKTASL